MGGTARGIARRIDLKQRQPRVIEKNPARIGQVDTASAARKKCDADLRFQIAHLPAQRRLRRVQPSFGREGETALFGDGNKVTQMAKFHRPHA